MKLYVYTQKCEKYCWYDDKIPLIKGTNTVPHLQCVGKFIRKGKWRNGDNFSCEMESEIWAIHIGPATSVDHNRSRFMLEAAKPARLVAELFTQSYNFWMTHVKKGPNIKDAHSNGIWPNSISTPTQPPTHL